MRKVKGNTLCVIQKATSSKNKIGEAVNVWTDAASVSGVLSLQSGDSKYSTFNAKIEESTHIFICDFDSSVFSLSDSNVRCIINGKMYDVLLIDNPDLLDIQLEIYLRLVGGQNG